MDKLCKTCGAVKPIDFFVKSKTCKSGYRGVCKECFNSYYRTRRVEKHELVRGYEKKFHQKRRLKYYYNLSVEEYNNMLASQDSLCSICKTQTKLVVDHCHTTGKVRGLLCNRCNMGLGHFKDTVALLKHAEEYLKKYERV